MKKRIVALLGALTLTFAMSLNVFAADSITADEINDVKQEVGSSVSIVENEEGQLFVSVEGVGEVEVVTDSVSLKAEADRVTAAQVKEEGVTEVTVTPVTAKESILATSNAFKVLKAANVEIGSEMSIAIKITPPKKGETITMAFDLKKINMTTDLAADEEIWAIDCETGRYHKGVVKGGNVYFTSNEFSNYIIAKVKVQAASTSQPPYNPDWDPAVQAERQAAAQAQHEAAWAAYLANGGVIPVVAVAPKTGDVVAMISIMAVIFLGGAVTAVAMSKKRA